MSFEFQVPELGEGIESADVVGISVSEGDAIDANQNVMELETEKAVVDLPCPHAGKIVKIHVSEGDTVRVGQTVLSLENHEPEKQPGEEAAGESEKQPDAKQVDEEPTPEEAGADVEEQPKAEADAAGPQEETAGGEADELERPVRSANEGTQAATETARGEEEQNPEEAEPEEVEREEELTRKGEEKAQAEGVTEDAKEPAADSAEEKAETEGDESPPPAGPATRRLARKLGVNLYQVRGSARGRRIMQEDVVAAHDRSDAGGAAQPSLPDFERFGPVERQRLNKIARTALKNLSTSWTVVPHVTQHDLADITDLDTARRRYLEGDGKSGPRITLTAIAVKAVITVLKEFPRANASLDAEREELILKKYYHIGVAVDTDEGLLVPVIRDADRKSIVELAAELADAAERARGRKLAVEDMQGATFTISNQGGIGGTAFTPIVSFPQVAILGMSRARNEVQIVDGQPHERLMLPLSLSYDHRVINGADAARFLVRLSAEFSDCFQLLIRT